MGPGQVTLKGGLQVTALPSGGASISATRVARETNNYDSSAGYGQGWSAVQGK